MVDVDRKKRATLKSSLAVLAAMSTPTVLAMGRKSLSVNGLAANGLAVNGLAMSAEEYRQHDAVSLAQLVKRKDVSASEVLEIAIARAQAVNPTINCIVEKLYERARSRVLDKLGSGPFAGVPFLLKDLGMALEGTVTTNGSRFYRGAVSDYTTTLVDRYEQAGLVIFGKTHSPEFGGTATTESILFGDTHNPWKQGFSAGGSSGGAAAAVAAGILPMANATDGGGSIRIPASCCGLFGLKPSRGRTPRGPHNLSSLMSAAHCVSRSVRDSAVLLDATHGPELGQTLLAPTFSGSYAAALGEPPKRLRIGLVTQAVTRSPVSDECITAVEQAAKLCEALGHDVEPIELPIDPREFFSATGLVMAAGTVNRVRSRELQLGRKVTEDDLEPLIFDRYQAALSNTSEQLFEAQKTLDKIARQVALLQKDVDVLLSPTMAKPPVEIGKMSLNQDYKIYEREAISASAFTIPYNATGQPAMSVPLHWTQEGLPVGVMFAGRFGDEKTLFQLAAQLEQAKPWFEKVPSI